MRRLMIGLALCGTLVAAWFAPDDDGGVIAPASAHARGAAAGAPVATSTTATAPLPAAAPGATTTVTASIAPTPNAAQMLDIHPRADDEELGNAFALQNWQNPAPLKPAAVRAQVQAEVAAAPKDGGAPALPIHFLGRYIDEGKVAYFLQVGERNVVARVGEKVDDNYLLQEAGADTLTFTYLPLHQQQTLAVGDIK